MIKNLLPISALFLGSALLLFAGGVNSLILPVRGAAEGFSAVSLGLLGTGWALGYVIGCILMPPLVSRVGHIRAFTVTAALAAVSILASVIFVMPAAWIPLRALSGICFAGAAMIVESWLSERTDAANRGKVFGIYTMINLGASTAGQMSLTLIAPDGYVFFVIGAIFYCLALVPVAITSSVSPKPLVRVRLDLMTLWRNSPIAVMGVFLVGVSNGSFATLAAVYAAGIGLPLNSVALFASIPILAGAVAQVPVGFLSDRMDRRLVLLGVAAVALGADVAFVILMPDAVMLNMVIVGVFGASVFSMYPIIVAHANDHAADGAFIQTSGGLLLVFGLGSVLGPLAAGYGMAQIGVMGLFLTTGLAHVVMIAYTLLRIMLRAAVSAENKGKFQVSLPGRATTPQTAALASGNGMQTAQPVQAPVPGAAPPEDVPKGPDGRQD